MKIKDTINRVEKSPEFKKWRISHDDSFLAHAFMMLDDANKDTIQIGYYSESQQSMSTFFVTPTVISLTADAEVLRGEGELRKLDLSKVKIDETNALEPANKIKDENYKNEKIIKHFFILQMFGFDAIYNITFITQSLKTLNVKINANSGEIISHSLESLISGQL